jgi:hypothetical protein
MKNEKLTTILVTLIFTAVLAFSWIYFKDYYASFAIVGGAIFSFVHVLSFLGSLIKFDDPDYDWLRKVSIAAAIVGSIILLSSGSQNKVEREEQLQRANQTEQIIQ